MFVMTTEILRKKIFLITEVSFDYLINEYVRDNDSLIMGIMVITRDAIYGEWFTERGMPNI